MTCSLKTASSADTVKLIEPLLPHVKLGKIPKDRVITVKEKNKALVYHGCKSLIGRTILG